MNAREAGFLLLTSKLGNPERNTLTMAQFRDLAGKAGYLAVDQPERELSKEDLLSLGYNRMMAERIFSLLQEEKTKAAARIINTRVIRLLLSFILDSFLLNHKNIKLSH